MSKTSNGKGKRQLRVQRVVRRQRRCQWLTELKGWKDCGDVATHVRVDCGLCYCRLHAKVLMPHAFLEPLPPNAALSGAARDSRKPETL